MISAQNLTKSFGRKEILRGISLRADTNQITLMVGPNGAGKSTTVKVLAGLIRPKTARRASTASTSSSKESRRNARQRICPNDRVFIQS